jgi:hypothetical protein
LPGEELRVYLTSGIMDELMDRAYASYYDPFRELVANSWDADATKVKIEVNENSLSIEDNGNGIPDLSLLLTKGSTEKKFEKQSPVFGRQFIGEKGLGFLSIFKICGEVQVLTRPFDKTMSITLTEDGIRESIDRGSKIPIEDAGPLLAYGTKVVMRKMRKQFNPDRVATHLSLTFSPLLSNTFRIYVNQVEVAPQPLPEGVVYRKFWKENEIVLVQPAKIEDRKPVRFYNRGVLVKRDILPKRPTITGYINTNLSLLTGRGGYVEDEEYNRFKRVLDIFVEQIPVTPSFPDVLVQRSLNKLARVLERALSKLDIPIPEEYRVQSEELSTKIRAPQKVQQGSTLPNGSQLMELLPNVKTITLKVGVPKKVKVRRVSFGTVREEQLSPSDYSVLTTEDSIIINLSHPHVSHLAALTGSYRELTLMPLVAEGFVDLLNPQTTEEYKATVDKVLREMLSIYEEDESTKHPHVSLPRLQNIEKPAK